MAGEESVRAGGEAAWAGAGVSEAQADAEPNPVNGRRAAVGQRVAVAIAGVEEDG